MCYATVLPHALCWRFKIKAQMCVCFEWNRAATYGTCEDELLRSWGWSGGSEGGGGEGLATKMEISVGHLISPSAILVGDDKLFTGS